jgi:hypothetical protein
MKGVVERLCGVVRWWWSSGLVLWPSLFWAPRTWASGPIRRVELKWMIPQSFVRYKIYAARQYKHLCLNYRKNWQIYNLTKYYIPRFRGIEFIFIYTYQDFVEEGLNLKGSFVGHKYCEVWILCLTILFFILLTLYLSFNSFSLC